MPFNFPDPATGQTTVTNPETGVVYQWHNPPGKWVVTAKATSDEIVNDISVLEQDVDQLKQDVDALELAVDTLETNTETLQQDVGDIEQQIEDELEVRDELIAANTGKNAAQDAAIAELDARVDSISENIGILEFKGLYTYSDVPDPLVAGSFSATTPDSSLANVTELIISDTDKNGDTLDWVNALAVNDYLELAEPNTIDGGQTGGDNALYEVTVAPAPSTGKVTIQVQYIKETGNGDGLLDLGIDYTIRVFKKDLGIDINEADARYLMMTGGQMTGNIDMSGGDEVSGSNIYMLNQGFIRFGYAGGAAEQYGGYLFMRDDNNFEIGTYSDKNITFKAASASYTGKVDMKDSLSFGGSTATSKDWVKFLNEKKANQTSVLRVNRPYDGDDGVNADGSTNAKGLGGLDIKLMANSDQNRLRIMGGSGANTETLRITGGGNGKQISSKSTIELSGGTDALQTIIAKSGKAGTLAYGDNDDNGRRISWGDSKVWIRNANLDMTMNEIYNVSIFKLVHQGSSGKKFSIQGESTNGPDDLDFFYSYKNAAGTLDAINYNGKMDSNSNIVNKKYVDDALAGANFDSYVKKAGDKMVGNLTWELAGTGIYFTDGTDTFADFRRLDTSTTILRAENSKSLKIQARDSNGQSRTYMDVQTKDSSGTQGSDSGYRCKIYHLADPTSDFHAANQRYVKAQDSLRVEGKFKITNTGGNYYIQPN